MGRSEECVDLQFSRRSKAHSHDSKPGNYSSKQHAGRTFTPNHKRHTSSSRPHSPDSRKRTRRDASASDAFHARQTWKCELCDARLPTRNILCKHQYQNHELACCCAYCDRHFSTMEQLVDHVNRTHRGLGAEKCFSCWRCFHVARSINEFWFHCRRYHAREVMKCKSCQLDLFGEKSYTNHRKLCEQKKLTPLFETINKMGSSCRYLLNDNCKSTSKEQDSPAQPLVQQKTESSTMQQAQLSFQEFLAAAANMPGAPFALVPPGYSLVPLPGHEISVSTSETTSVATSMAQAFPQPVAHSSPKDQRTTKPLGMEPSMSSSTEISISQNVPMSLPQSANANPKDPRVQKRVLDFLGGVTGAGVTGSVFNNTCVPGAVSNYSCITGAVKSGAGVTGAVSNGAGGKTDVPANVTSRTAVNGTNVNVTETATGKDTEKCTVADANNATGPSKVTDEQQIENELLETSSDHALKIDENPNQDENPIQGENAVISVTQSVEKQTVTKEYLAEKEQKQITKKVTFSNVEKAEEAEAEVGCKICGKRFSSRAHYRDHILTKHFERFKQEKPKIALTAAKMIIKKRSEAKQSNKERKRRDMKEKNTEKSKKSDLKASIIESLDKNKRDDKKETQTIAPNILPLKKQKRFFEEESVVPKKNGPAETSKTGNDNASSFECRVCGFVCACKTKIRHHIVYEHVVNSEELFNVSNGVTKCTEKLDTKNEQEICTETLHELRKELEQLKRKVFIKNSADKF